MGMLRKGQVPGGEGEEAWQSTGRAKDVREGVALEELGSKAG